MLITQITPHNTSRVTSRPKSATLISQHRQSPSAHRYKYRLSLNQSLNQVKNNINSTFAPENKRTKHVKQLIGENMDAKTSKRIDQLCVKYSMCVNPKRRKGLIGAVDVQFIAKNFIKNKSQQKQKHIDRQKLVQSVSRMSHRNMQPALPQFFTLTHKSLLNLQQTQKGQSLSPSTHPYIRLYHQSQLQTFNSMTNKYNLQLQEWKYPATTEPQDWEKELRMKKSIYAGIKQMRKLHSARESRGKRSSVVS